jgi:hypothetical protein
MDTGMPNVVALCLSEPYPTALSILGISYTTYLAVRRENRFPPRNNLARRNMELRTSVFALVRENPTWTYRRVAVALGVSLPRVWKVFAEYMLHDSNVRALVCRTGIGPM